MCLVDGNACCDCERVTDYVGRTRHAVLHPAPTDRGGGSDRRAIRVLHTVQALALLAIVVVLVAALS